MADLVRVYLEITAYLPQVDQHRKSSMRQTLAAIAEYLQDNGGVFTLEEDESVSVRGGPFAVRSREYGQRSGRQGGERSGQRIEQQSEQRSEQRSERQGGQQSAAALTPVQLHAARGAFRQMPAEPEEPFAWTPAQVVAQQHAARSNVRQPSADIVDATSYGGSRASQDRSSRPARNLGRSRQTRTGGTSRKHFESNSNLEEYSSGDLDY
jgi:hypothetical protein